MNALLPALLLALLLALGARTAGADEGVYRSSNAAFVATAQIDLFPRSTPTLQATLLVSDSPFAGTTQPLYATFQGTFASSGPHSLGVLSQYGGSYSSTIQLDRKIGELVGVWLEVKGPDSLLLQSISCLMGSSVYHFELREQWLEQWDPELARKDEGDGFSPDADRVLPSAPTLFAPTSFSYLAFTDTGLLSTDPLQ